MKEFTAFLQVFREPEKQPGFMRVETPGFNSRQLPSKPEIIARWDFKWSSSHRSLHAHRVLQRMVTRWKFRGPSAEGVDMYENGKQICTWRTFLGGTQYGNIFPTFLGEWLGLGSIPWIWKNCPDRILEGIAKALGEEQTRRLIMEYRAKLALLDMKKWSEACRRLLNDNFGRSLGAEWEPYWINCETWKATPYAKTTVDENGVLVPEQRTTPGWSGANQIPLVVTGNLVSVDFQPVTEENMSCQLCYRATDGTAIYSKPVKSGTALCGLTKHLRVM
jgi:hypothetical protein